METRHLHQLTQSLLFSAIAEEEIPSMLACLDSRTVAYQKADMILRAGEPVQQMGILLEGNASVIKEDADGERSLVTQLEPGDNFAEALCCAGVQQSPVSVRADTPALVLLLNFKRILLTCPKACTYHSKLIENMLFVVATKNLQIQTRMDYLSKKTLRKRLLKYLSNQSGPGSQPFSIPFNREELADYLCADRSALSRELAKLKDEGQLDYWKNQFRLL